MNAIEKITNYITRLENKDDLQTIAQAVTKRLDELSRRKGSLYLELIDGIWYALELGNDGERKGVTLGKQLTMSQALKQARVKQPVIQDFEVTPKQAAELRKQNPERVGWWHDSDNQHHLIRYYDIPPYQAAIAKWKRDHDLAHDPLAMVFRMSIETVQKLRELEGAGYEIVYPDGLTK